MKCVIQFHNMNAARGYELLHYWEKQDEGYYGKPHGYKEVDAPLALIGMGFSGGGKIKLGYSEDQTGNGGCWMTSSGNWAALVPVKNGYWRLFIDSRRHGLPLGVSEMFAGLEWNGDGEFVTKEGYKAATVIQYDTMCPENSPLECGLTPKTNAAE